MNTLKKTEPNRLEQSTEALANFTKNGYKVPKEIREDEAHLNHILVLNSAPQKDLSFKVTAKLVKVNDESLEVMKTQFTKFGTVVILHDAKQYKAELAELEAKAKADKRAEEEANNLKIEEAKKEAELAENAKDEEIATLKAELAKAKKDLAPANKKEEAKKEAEGDGSDKKPSGKG